MQNIRNINISRNRWCLRTGHLAKVRQWWEVMEWCCIFEVQEVQMSRRGFPGQAWWLNLVHRFALRFPWDLRKVIWPHQRRTMFSTRPVIPSHLTRDRMRHIWLLNHLPPLNSHLHHRKQQSNFRFVKFLDFSWPNVWWQFMIVAATSQKQAWIHLRESSRAKICWSREIQCWIRWRNSHDSGAKPWQQKPCTSNRN